MPVLLEQHEAELAEHGVAPEVIELLTYLFKEVVDGRNADTTDGVQPRARPGASGLHAVRAERGCQRRVTRSDATSVAPSLGS